MDQLPALSSIVSLSFSLEVAADAFLTAMDSKTKGKKRKSKATKK